MSGGGGGGDEYGRAVARVAVVQLLEAAGFHSASESAVDAMVDVVIRYVGQLGRSAAFHAGVAGRTSGNVFDVLQALEEVSGGAALVGAPRLCLAGSSSVKAIQQFVSSNEEIPFTHAIPRFPVQWSSLLLKDSICSEVGKEPGRSHIPNWLPAFPNPHTYIHTDVWNEVCKEPGADKVEQAKQRRKAEKALLSLQRRLALAAANGPDGSGFANHVDAERQKEIAIGNNASNPFLAPPLPYGAKDVSEIGEFDGNNQEGASFPVLDAFAPVIEAAKWGGHDRLTDQAHVLPKERSKLHFRIGVDRKSLIAELSSRACDRRSDVLLIRDDKKDERKRKAEMILKEAMENPHDLTQL